MKRIQLRSARRQEADEAVKPVTKKLTSKRGTTVSKAPVAVVEVDRTVDEISSLGRNPFTGERTIQARDGRTVTLSADGTRIYETREQAVQAGVAQFRRVNRAGEAARIQEFGNRALCTGTLRAESTTVCWGVGARARLDALVLFSHNADSRPHYLGHSCETGEPFIFVDIPAACVAARNIAGLGITDPGSIESFYDNRFLQVDRDYELDNPSRDPYDFDVTFFAQFRAGREFTSRVMITVEMHHWMGNWEAYVWAWAMDPVPFVPTAFEKAGAALSNLSNAFKRIGGGGRDLRRAQEVRFVKRPGRNEWIDHTLGETFSLRPSQYDI